MSGGRATAQELDMSESDRLVLFRECGAVSIHDWGTASFRAAELSRRRSLWAMPRAPQGAETNYGDDALGRLARSINANC
jgi:hypothetical protein